MDSLPYYISWTKQNNASTFPIESVDGVKIKTTDGLTLTDMTSISYQAHFGHNHPEIIKQIKLQLDSIPMSSPKGITPHKNAITRELLDYMDLPEGKIFYTTGGSETIENALKIARDITKRKIVLARKTSYHGATLGALTATGDWRNAGHQLPENWVVRIPEPSEVDAIIKTRQIVRDIGHQNIAAIIIETITGGNGVYSATQEWWDGISTICRESKIMLIMDEVVCGFERTGKAFGYMHYDVNPDMICLAKGITGGMIPFGALWTNQKISDYYQENVLSCGLTNYAHPLGMAAMKGVLNIVKNDSFKENLKEVEKFFLHSLRDIEKLKNVKEVRVHGMLAAIDLTQSIEWKSFYKKGLYLVSQPNRIILAPPLIISPQELSEAMKQIHLVIKEHEK